MDVLALSRLQFAITTVYHFFFVPLTLGLSVIVAIMETMYVRTGKDEYKRMTKFWGKLFIINFAMGVVTGIVQEFQFGMNWSEYSRMVGDIFGAPLAVEALLAFFLESVFLGLWIFGWDKLSKPMHAVTIWLVAIGSNLSAFWILVANSFMHEPVGYVLRNGRAEMESFMALLKNKHLWLQFPHVVFAGLTTGAFFVIGISIYHISRKQHISIFKPSFKIAIIVASIAIIGVGVVGHSQGQEIVNNQPMKIASLEALWHTENPASFSLFSITDFAQKREVFSVRVPYVLSLLMFNRFEGEVKGIYELQEELEATYGPGDYIPPVAVMYWAFRFMVSAGTILGLLALYGLYMRWKNNYALPKRLSQLFVLSLFLPYIANSAGWILTEVGRFPWVVYGVMKVEDAVSVAVSTAEVWTTLIGFTLLYGLLMVADVYLLRKYALQVDDENDMNQFLSNDDDFEISLIGAE